MKVRQIFEIILRSYEEKTNVTYGDVEWLLEEHDDYVVIAFRGSEFSGSSLLPDLIRNVRALIPWYNKHLGWCSEGYLSGAKCALSQIYRVLESKGHLEKPIIVCGHSLGAAVAYFVARMLQHDGVHVRAWVAAGGVNCVMKRTTHEFVCMNFKYEEDIISVYPPRFLGFKQPTEFLNIGVDDSGDHFLDLGDLSDHRMTNYLANAPDYDV